MWKFKAHAVQSILCHLVLHLLVFPIWICLQATKTTIKLVSFSTCILKLSIHMCCHAVYKHITQVQWSIKVSFILWRFNADFLFRLKYIFPRCNQGSPKIVVSIYFWKNCFVIYIIRWFFKDSVHTTINDKCRWNNIYISLMILT